VMHALRASIVPAECRNPFAPPYWVGTHATVASCRMPSMKRVTRTVKNRVLRAVRVSSRPVR